MGHDRPASLESQRNYEAVGRIAMVPGKCGRSCGQISVDRYLRNIMVFKRLQIPPGRREGKFEVSRFILRPDL